MSHPKFMMNNSAAMEGTRMHLHQWQKSTTMESESLLELLQMSTGIDHEQLDREENTGGSSLIKHNL